MATRLERLEKYFKENDEWHDYNQLIPGNENPYPRKIQSAFIPHLKKNYIITVTYHNEEGRLIIENPDEDTLWDATYHAWFDCSDLDGCIDLMRVWLRDFYEEYYSGERYVDKVNISIESKVK